MIMDVKMLHCFPGRDKDDSGGRGKGGCRGNFGSAAALSDVLTNGCFSERFSSPFADDPALEVTQDPGVETAPTGKQIEVALGGAVQLQCPEDTTGCWSRVGVGGRLEAVGPGPGLAIEDILYQDAGEYRCVAGRRGSYDKWRSEVNVDVTVKGKRKLYSVVCTYRSLFRLRDISSNQFSFSEKPLPTQ